MISTFEGKHPRIAHDTYIHPSADSIGGVQIGSGCWIGPGARIRGDYGRIVIGDNTSIEDNCVIHARPNDEAIIGSWVTIGHGAIIHNARIHNWAVLGMGCIVSDWALIGEWAAVGEGTVVIQHQAVPAGRIAVGVPARLLEKAVTPEYKNEWEAFKRTYVDLAWRYMSGLETPTAFAEAH